MGERNKAPGGSENEARFSDFRSDSDRTIGVHDSDLALRPKAAIGRRVASLGSTLIARWVLCMAAVGTLVLTLAPSSRAQNPDAQPAALSKLRATLYVQATRAPLMNLESEVNHLAMLSETCRVEHGAQACGLSDKPLESSKLEDRYAYYVKQPVEAHSKVQGVKIQRRNWEGSAKAVTNEK